MEARQYTRLETIEGLEIGVWYVYVDYTLNEDRPFYVGKGNKERVKKRERNVHWKNIVTKHGWDLSKRKIILVIKDEQFSLEQERVWIAKLGTFEDGTLGRWGANRTQGGESTASMSGEKNWMFNRSGDKHPRFGIKHTPQSIEKNRAANTGANHRFFGKKRPASVAEKIRIGNSGERSNSTHLTWSDVQKIRELFATNEWTQVALGGMFNISRAAVWKIVRGLTWKPVVT